MLLFLKAFLSSPPTRLSDKILINAIFNVHTVGISVLIPEISANPFAR